MNIYKILWNQVGSLISTAVVIANTKEEAYNILDLEHEGNIHPLEIDVFLIGVCTDGTKEPLIVCQEE
jgi:hypothetical protein